MSRVPLVYVLMRLERELVNRFWVHGQQNGAE